MDNTTSKNSVTQLLTQGRVPPRYFNYTMAGYEEARLIKYVQGKKAVLDNFAKDKISSRQSSNFHGVPGESSFRFGLFISGPARSGKTYLLTYLAKCFAVNGFGGFSYHSFDDVKELHFNDKSFVFRKTYLDIQVLLLDGVSIPLHEGYRTCLSRLLRLRCDYGLPTVIASDLTPTDFAHYYSLPRVLENPGSAKRETVPDTEIANLFASSFVPVQLFVWDNSYPDPRDTFVSEIDVVNAYGKELKHGTNV